MSVVKDVDLEAMPTSIFLSDDDDDDDDDTETFYLLTYPSFLPPCVLGVIGLRTFLSSALSFPGAKSMQMKLSFPLYICSLERSLPWNFRSSEANIPRTFVPWNFRSGLWNFRSFRTNRLFQEFLLQASKNNLKL